MKFSYLCLHGPKTIIEVHRRITAAGALKREGHITYQPCLEIKKMLVQQPLAFGSKSTPPAYPHVLVLIHPYSFGTKQNSAVFCKTLWLYPIRQNTKSRI